MANNPDAAKNLKPFQKGQSGNRKGRPKKLPELDKLLVGILGEKKDGITAAEAILMKLRQKATSGDIRAAELLLDRAYGKVKQQTIIQGQDPSEVHAPIIIQSTSNVDYDRLPVEVLDAIIAAKRKDA